MKINWDKIERKNQGFFEYSLLARESDVLLNIGFTHRWGYRDVDVSVSNYFNYVDFIKYLDSENFKKF